MRLGTDPDPEKMYEEYARVLAQIAPRHRYRSAP